MEHSTEIEWGKVTCSCRLVTFITSQLICNARSCIELTGRKYLCCNMLQQWITLYWTFCSASDTMIIMCVQNRCPFVVRFIVMPNVCCLIVCKSPYFLLEGLQMETLFWCHVCFHPELVQKYFDHKFILMPGMKAAVKICCCGCPLKLLLLKSCSPECSFAALSFV